MASDLHCRRIDPMTNRHILLTGATVFSQLGLGLLSDHVSPWLLASLTLSAASLATFMFWGVAGHAVAGLFVFGATYGLLAGGFSSLYTAFVRPIASENIFPRVSGVRRMLNDFPIW